jgi:hypothetical protein
MNACGCCETEVEHALKMSRYDFAQSLTHLERFVQDLRDGNSDDAPLAFRAICLAEQLRLRTLLEVLKRHNLDVVPPDAKAEPDRVRWATLMQEVGTYTVARQGRAA